jgi:hypothetical protein
MSLARSSRSSREVIAPEVISADWARSVGFVPFSSPRRRRASPEQQRRARIFGVLFALTFVTSIAGLLLYDPVLNDADYILGDGADTRVRLGALCEIFLAITNIGTAVVL